MVLSVGRSAAIAGIVIVALMIAGTIPVTVGDGWLWGLLALFIVSFFVNRRRGRRPWEQRWWWEWSESKESGCCRDDSPEG
jgi:hypothetical protein